MVDSTYDMTNRRDMTTTQLRRRMLPQKMEIKYSKLVLEHLSLSDREDSLSHYERNYARRESHMTHKTLLS
jgi:hypothetical protein